MKSKRIDSIKICLIRSAINITSKLYVTTVSYVNVVITVTMSEIMAMTIII